MTGYYYSIYGKRWDRGITEDEDGNPLRRFNPPSPLAGRLRYSNSDEISYLTKLPRGQEADYRTVVVHVDGACSGNGTAFATAGFGVYFGGNSSRNYGKRISAVDYPTSEYAHLCAAQSGLRYVYDTFRNDDDISRVIIASNCQNVVKGFSEWVFKWEKNGWTKSDGKPLANVYKLQQISSLIRQMERENWIVKFYKVDCGDNHGAEQLAQESFDESESEDGHDYDYYSDSCDSIDQRSDKSNSNSDSDSDSSRY